MKVSDITQAFDKNQKKVKEAKEKLDVAQENYNRAYVKASKEGKELGNEFTAEVAKKVREHLNLNERLSNGLGDSLVEMYIADRGESKVSIHNRKYMNNQDQSITFMIRDMNDRYLYEGVFPEDVTVEDAVELILDNLPDFMRK